MIRALVKTSDRTSRFLGGSLAGRSPDRQYFVVAWGLIAGALWLVANLPENTESPVVVLMGLYLVAVLAAICAIDARYGIIPDSLVAAIAVGGAIQTFLLTETSLMQRGIEAVLVLIGGYLFRGLYSALRGYEGLGQGDLKFAAAGVFWVGLEGIAGLLLAAVLSALASLSILKAQGFNLHGKLPISFGPHLAVALWLIWILDSLQLAF